MSEVASGFGAGVKGMLRRWREGRRTRRQAKRNLKEAEREQKRARRREKAKRRRLLRSARSATGSRQVSRLHRNESGWWIQDRIGRWWRLGGDEAWRLWEPGAHEPAWRARAATISHSYLLLELQDRQNELLEEQNRLLQRAAGEGEPATARKQISLDPEDAGLLLSLCEPGSTLEEPSITEGNFRRFVVAQAEAERQRRLKAERATGGDEPTAST